MSLKHIGNIILQTAVGRTIYSYLFLLAFCIVVPLAIFAQVRALFDVAWVISIILGIFIFTSGVVTTKEAYQSKLWPTVTVSDFECSLNIHSSKYSPSVECLFEVNGEIYSGTQYDFSDSYSSKASARMKIEKVKNRRYIEVYYNPLNPSMNVLNPGVRVVHFLRLIIGAAIPIICFLFWQGYLSLPE